MGNSSSCSPIQFSSSSRSVKVVDTEGKVEEYRRQVMAAELMLENPQHFLCDARHLHAGRRIPVVVADQELEQRRVYFLLPMEMLYSVLSQKDMESLSLKVSLATRRMSTDKMFGSIFPLLGECCIFPSQNRSKKEEANSAAAPVCLTRQRSSLQWRPSLYTIVETPRRL
ncbi:unnamed protein product [Victoria cruziana]